MSGTPLGGQLARIAAASFALLATPWAYADVDTWSPTIERFTAREGLPAETINFLLIDRAGVLWIGSREGLYSYDGYSFTGYVHDIADPDSLVDNWVRTIFEDSASNLWVGTNTGGLARLDRATGQFRTFRHDPAAPDTLSHDSVYAIAEGADGALWVGTQSGLNLFDPRTGRVRRVPVLPPPNPHSGAEYIPALLPDDDGALWIATIGDGVLRFEPTTGSVVREPVEDVQPPLRGATDAFTLAFDLQKNLWIGCRAGVVVRRRSDGSLTKLVSPTGARMPIESTVVPIVAADPAGSMWIGAFSGIFRVDAPPSPAWWIGPSAGLGREPITALTLSRDGSVWVGSVGAGLRRILPHLAGFRAIRAGSGQAPSLTYDEVTTVLEDRQGRLLVGTFGGGINRLDPGAADFVRVPLRLDGRPVADGVLRLAEDRTGRVWIGTTEGLYFHDPRDGTVTAFLHDPTNPASLGRGYIFAVLVDSDDQVWVGAGGGGLHRLRPDGRSFEKFLLRADDPGTPSDDFVTVLYEDRTGRIWEGTRSGGLNLIDRRTGRATRIPVDPQDPGALAHHYVTTVLEDQSGQLWVGTGGGGLARLVEFDPVRGPRFARVTARDGLAEDAVMSIVEDDDGSLWVATRRGLTRYDPRRGAFVSYDVADGLPSSEGNLGAAGRGRDGLYIGTMNGLIQIPRRTAFPDPPPARLAITGVKTPRGPAAPSGSGWPPARVQVGHGEVLSVEFAVLDFDPHRRHRYAYRLRERDAPWIDLGVRRDLTFTDLAPGEHILQVRGRGARGGWSDPPATLALRIVPPFYRTTWFRLALGAGLIATAIIWHRVRTEGLKRRNRELLELHAQREAALGEARTKEVELQDALGRLRQLTRRLEAAREEKRKEIARELHDEMGQMLTAAKINIQLMQRQGAEGASASRTADTIDLIDRMIKLVRALSVDLRPQLMDELGLVAALRSHLEAQAWRGDLKLDFRAEGLPAHLPAELEIATFRLVQEAVTNVVRHAEASHVDVLLRGDNSRLQIVVRDDGRGFVPEEAAERRRSEPHIGLPGMEERAQALGGELTIDSAPGRGTTIRVELPLTVEESP